MNSRDESVESLVTIPGLGPGEQMVVESILQAAGILFISLPGDYEGIGPRIQIRSSDLKNVKELLIDFRIERLNGDEVPIPWES